MNRFANAGVIWIAAAAFAIAMTIIFRIDALQWVVTIAVGAVAAVVGLWLISAAEHAGGFRVERRRFGVDPAVWGARRAAIRRACRLDDGCRPDRDWCGGRTRGIPRGC